jgi:3-phytase
MRRRPTLVLFFTLVFVLTVGSAAAVDVATVHATLETEPFLESDDADADDPAIWVHPTRRDESIVVGTLKNAGLAVFDLDGETIQRIDYADEEARQNNVDLVYDISLGGRTRDLAIVTDRGRDHLRVFSIDPAGGAAAEPLQDVTVPNPPVVFEGNSDISAYGIAAWKSSAGEAFVAVSQRHRTAIALLRLVAGPSGTIGFERVDSLPLPSTFPLKRGGSWTPCTEENGELPQVEGMVADARRGFLFAAQEDVGIWRIAVDGGTFGGAKLFDRVREFGRPYTRTFDPDEEEFVCEIDEDAPSAGSEYLAADAEGLTIYRLDGARGYLLASSQGSSTFVVYDLSSLKLLRMFRIGEGATDDVDESDGAMVANVPLGATFARGLLVTHDGDEAPGEDATNFKFTRWEDVAGPLGLEIDINNGDPRS